MSSKAAGAIRSKPPITHANAPLFQFSTTPVQPKWTQPPKTVPSGQKNRVPSWARAYARPALQPVLDYTDQDGNHRRLHIAQKWYMDEQDIEIKEEIANVKRNGGSNLRLDIIAVSSGATVSRWKIV
jgi:hypothetical protein